MLGSDRFEYSHRGVPSMSLDPASRDARASDVIACLEWMARQRGLEGTEWHLAQTHSRWTEGSAKSTRTDRFCEINSLRSRIVGSLWVRFERVGMSRSTRRMNSGSVSHGSCASGTKSSRE